MLSNYVFDTRFCRKFALVMLLMEASVLTSCTGRKGGDEGSNHDDGLSVEDEWEAEEDTLVYDLPETPLPETVDESFLDFFYTFLHRRSFQLERVNYPVEVTDEMGEVVETLRNGRSITEALHFLDSDYLVMLLGENDDPYDYLSRNALHAELQQLTLQSGSSRSYAFDRGDEGWKFSGIHYEGAGRNESFVRFYHSFVCDSLFRSAHLADEIFISIPSSEDEMEMVDGNIDPTQWEVFTPELPQQQLLLLDLGESDNVRGGVKFVKCSVASSMLEVLTFEKTDNDWKLVRYEE